MLAAVLMLGCCTAMAACSAAGSDSEDAVSEIERRGTLLVGTTGDYRPLTFREADGSYWGFCIEVAQAIAGEMGVKTEFVPTSWPTLTDDVTAEPPAFATPTEAPSSPVAPFLRQQTLRHRPAECLCTGQEAGGKM